MTVKAIFEKGVFRPVDPVDLPENREVESEVRIVSQEGKPGGLNDIYAILGQRSARAKRRSPSVITSISHERRVPRHGRPDRSVERV